MLLDISLRYFKDSLIFPYSSLSNIQTEAELSRLYGVPVVTPNSYEAVEPWSTTRQYAGVKSKFSQNGGQRACD